MNTMTFVTIERKPFGISQFSDCSMKLIGGDTVTVTRNDTGWIVESFGPGRWRSAVLYNADGLLLHSFMSGSYEQEQTLEQDEPVMQKVRRR